MKVISSCIVGVLLFMAGCSSDPPVVSHGSEVLSVDPAFAEQVSIALVDVHREMAHWIDNEDNTKSDPSYKAGSRRWKTGTGDNEKITCERSYMEFRTDKDILVRIETVFIPDQTLLVSLDCDDEEETFRLHNMVMEKIRAKCVGES
ncbi:MAG: hypothetical protein JXA82_15660 [Sedimentisphaerales bacterium]|nr:hypothetical protein [Sedimentisphaerales bacterium]